MTTPADTELVEQLLLGRLPPDEAERLLDRLEDPSLLAAVARSLPGRDTLVEALRSQATEPLPPPDARLEAMMNLIETAGSSPAGPTSESAAVETASGVVPPGPPPAAAPFLAPPEAPDEIGRLGGYRVLEVLGRGGMGLVLLADDVALKRRVALKVMSPEAATGPPSRERFRREALATAAVEHEHVVAIHAVGEDRGVPFLVMPLLKGETLDARLRRDGRLPPAEVVRVGREAAEGLAAAHERGLIHRDVKPSNIWLEGRRAKVKLLDFGLAQPVEPDTPITQSGTLLGTPAYMAPEQAGGEAVDGRADLFSLGCVLYHAATGERPFTGSTVMAVLTSLAVHHPAPAAQVNPAVPAELSALIGRLLAKEPDRRPASAEVVAAELTAIEERLRRPALPPADADRTEPIPAPSVVRPAAAPRKWNRARVAAVAAGLLIAVVGGLFAAGVIRIETAKGTLVIEGADDDVEVVIRKGGAVIKDKVKAREIELKVGDYTIELAEKGDGLRLATDKFTITRGGKTPIKVYLDKAVAKAPAPRDGDEAAVRKAVDWALSSGGRVTVIRKGFATDVKSGDELRPGTDSLDLVSVRASPEKGVDEAALLTNLALLKNLGWLSLYDFSLTEADLERLTALPGVAKIGALYLTDTKLPPAGLAHLKRLPNLGHLLLSGPNLTDADLKPVGELASLSRLTLQRTRVTGPGLAELRGPGLKILDLQANPTIDSAALGHLRGVTGLRHLHIFATPVRDEGLAALKGMPWLEELSFQDAGVTDAGLAHLAGLDRLKSLFIAEPAVTDAGLAKLKGLTGLEGLTVNCPGVTDAGLAHLTGFARLRNLNLTRTRVTPGGVKKLAAALPNCTIESDHGTFGPKSPTPKDDGR